MTTTQIHPSVKAAREIDTKGREKDIAAVLRSLRTGTNPDEARAKLAVIRDELGETVYGVAKFRAAAILSR